MLEKKKKNNSFWLPVKEEKSWCVFEAGVEGGYTKFKEMLWTNQCSADEAESRQVQDGHFNT